MTIFRKVVKYLALILAIFLIVAMIKLITDFSFGNNSNYNGFSNVKGAKVEKVKIELSVIDLLIQEGTSFNVESTTDDLNIYQTADKVIISEKERHFFRGKNNQKLIVTIPKNKIYKDFSVVTGAGSIQVETLNSQNVSLVLKAGKLEVDNINVTESITVNSNTGSVKIKNGVLNNLNLKLKIGECLINSQLNGNNEISSGIGTVSLVLPSDVKNYKFKIEKGLGSVTINDEKVKEKDFSVGKNVVELKAGIGGISIITDNSLHSNL